MAAFTQIVEQASDILWNYLLLFLLVGTGIFFTIKLHFVQLSSFADGVRHLFKGFSLHGKAADKDGMSSFQALATAIAAQVGTGNITGCATALVSGNGGILAAGQAQISANGLTSFHASDVSLSQHISAAQAAIAASGGAAVAGEFALWQEGADAYLLVSDATAGLGAADVLIKLTGVTLGSAGATLAGGDIIAIS